LPTFNEKTKKKNHTYTQNLDQFDILVSQNKTILAFTQADLFHNFTSPFFSTHILLRYPEHGENKFEVAMIHITYHHPGKKP
jgi:hypothetical protein